MKFSDMDAKHKKIKLIKLLFPPQDVDSVIAGSFYEIDEKYVQNVIAVSIQDTFMDQSKLRGKKVVDIKILEKYFTYSGFQKLKTIIINKIHSDYWTCFECKQEATGNLIQCESDLRWAHKNCVGYEDDNSKIMKPFFCTDCKKEYK